MFGAWQAGAWQALSKRFDPDLIVGASVGALNGCAIASSWSAEELCAWWLQSPLEGISHRFQDLPQLTRALLDARPLEREFAVVLVDVLRLKPRAFRGPEITAKHLVASCAVPGAVAPQRVDGRWYADGGLLNPLPVWAAVELGATRIIALNALPEIPSVLLRPFVKTFRLVFGYNPRLPPEVQVTTLGPSVRLGGLGDALKWDRENIQRWLKQGAADASQTFPI